MLDVQALKAAIAIITCEKYSDCSGCYLEYVNCEDAANETVDKIKSMLIEMGYPYEERITR